MSEIKLKNVYMYSTSKFDPVLWTEFAKQLLRELDDFFQKKTEGNTDFYQAMLMSKKTIDCLLFFEDIKVSATHPNWSDKVEDKFLAYAVEYARDMLPNILE